MPKWVSRHNKDTHLAFLNLVFQLYFHAEMLLKISSMVSSTTF